VIAVTREGEPRQFARRVHILGPSRVIAKPDDPLMLGGAVHVWIETDGPIEME